MLDNAGDIYGDSVNVAARIVGLAKTGQVIVDARAGRLDSASTCARASARSARSRSKGGARPVEILEYIWEGSPELTMLRPSDSTAAAIATAPDLRRSRSAVLDEYRPGRDHARTRCRVGHRHRATVKRHGSMPESRSVPDRFVLVDHSSNGTYVVIGNEAEVWVRREEVDSARSRANRAGPSDDGLQRDGRRILLRVTLSR